MPTFTYQARSKGQTVSGEIEATDKRVAAVVLRKRGVTPLKLEEAGAGGRAARKSKRARRGGRIKARDVTMATRQLATLLSSGLPLARGLSFLAEQAENPTLGAVFQALERDLRAGRQFSESLAEHPRCFDHLYLSMVKAGEAGGILDTAVDRLAAMREAREDLVGKVKGALFYPAFMLTAMAGAVAVLLTFVVPRFAELFADLGHGLPLPTLLLLRFSNGLQTIWWAIPPLGLAFLWGYRKYASTKRGRYRLDSFYLKLPKVGPLLLQVSLARFASAMASLLKAGVPLLSALSAASGVAGNEVVAHAVDAALKQVREGKRLAETLAATGAFTRYFTEMTAIGEESGALDDMFQRVAATYERDIDQTVKNLTGLFEPAMILLLGGVVGFIVVAMLMPVFEMNLVAG